MSFCPQCGKATSPGANFCVACGTSLQAISVDSPSISGQVQSTSPPADSDRKHLFGSL